MIESLAVAAELTQTDRDEAATIGLAEGQACLALIRRFRDDDWQRPTDCPEWDVRTMVAHLVGQCEDGMDLRTLLRRELTGRLRYRGRAGVDAHMAAQVDDHRGETGRYLAERFAQLWPRAITARHQMPQLLRRVPINPGTPGAGRWRLGYLVDVIYNRDLWMHRIDLSRATRLPFAIGGHDQQIVAQVIRDLARNWSGAAIALELTGPAGGAWLIGFRDPIAAVRADAIAYLRALAGRDDDVPVELVWGDAAAVPRARQARVPF